MPGYKKSRTLLTRQGVCSQNCEFDTHSIKRFRKMEANPNSANLMYYPFPPVLDDTMLTCREGEIGWRFKNSPTTGDDYPLVRTSWNGVGVSENLMRKKTHIADKDERALAVLYDQIEFVGPVRKTSKYNADAKFIEPPTCLTGGTTSVKGQGSVDIDIGDTLVYRIPHPTTMRPYREKGVHPSKVITVMEPYHPSQRVHIDTLREILEVTGSKKMQKGLHVNYEDVPANRVALALQKYVASCIYQGILGWVASDGFGNGADTFDQETVLQQLGLKSNRDSGVQMDIKLDSGPFEKFALRSGTGGDIRIEKMVSLIATGVHSNQSFIQRNPEAKQLMMNAATTLLAELQGEANWFSKYSAGKAMSSAKAGEDFDLHQQKTTII
ncbi:MAG: hypothetical protein ACTSUE_03860 [Promethearchaeota archaeon]